MIPDAGPVPPALPALPEHPPVSYIMPVLNEADYLEQAVAAVLSQEYAGEQELVLALGASSDGTAEVAERICAADPRVRVVPNPRNDIPIGLNLAIKAARFKVIVRVDAHSDLPAGYTATAVELLRQTGAANLGGMMVAKGRTPFQRAVARAYNSPFGLGGGSWHHGETETEAASAYLGVFRREALEEAGLYDESLRRAEDWELNYRIRSNGHKIIFTPRLKVTYWPRSTWQALRKQMYATGVWRGHLVRKQGRTPLQYLAPPAVVVLICASVLLAALSPLLVLLGMGYLLFALVPAGLYLLGLLAVSLLMPWDGLAGIGRNVEVLATMHLAWGAGFIRGWSSGAERTVDRSRVK